MGIEAARLYATLDARDVGLSRKLRAAGTEMDALHGRASRMGKGIMVALGVGGAATGAIELGAHIVKTGMAFDTQMSRVQALSGATGKSFQQLRGEAMKLGAQSVFTSEQAAEGMEKFAAAGMKPAAVMAAMPGLVNAAAVSGEGMAATADVMTTALGAFNLKASAAAHVADVLARSSNESKASVADMGESLKYAAPMANTAGLSIEDLSAVLTIMAKSGIQASMAGTETAMALQRLASPPAKARDELKKLNIEVADAHGKFRPFADIVGDLHDKFQGLTQVQRMQAATAIFGAQASRGMIKVIEAGKPAVKGFSDEFVKANGSAKDMAKTMLDNVHGDLLNLTGSLELAEIKLYDRFKAPLRLKIEAVNEYVNSAKFMHDAEAVEGAVVQVGSAVEHTAKFLFEHRQAVKLVAEAYIGWKVAMKGLAVAEGAQGLMNLFDGGGAVGGVGRGGSMLGKVAVEAPAAAAALERVAASGAKAEYSIAHAAAAASGIGARAGAIGSASGGALSYGKVAAEMEATEYAASAAYASTVKVGGAAEAATAEAGRWAKYAGAVEGAGAATAATAGETGLLAGALEAVPFGPVGLAIAGAGVAAGLLYLHFHHASKGAQELSSDLVANQRLLDSTQKSMERRDNARARGAGSESPKRAREEGIDQTNGVITLAKAQQGYNDALKSRHGLERQASEDAQNLKTVEDQRKDVLKQYDAFLKHHGEKAFDFSDNMFAGKSGADALSMFTASIDSSDKKLATYQGKIASLKQQIAELKQLERSYNDQARQAGENTAGDRAANAMQASGSKIGAALAGISPSGSPLKSFLSAFDGDLETAKRHTETEAQYINRRLAKVGFVKASEEWKAKQAHDLAEAKAAAAAGATAINASLALIGAVSISGGALLGSLRATLSSASSLVSHFHLPHIPGLPGAATGGILHGPGTGTSDSIIARLSNGEAVIPAKQVALHPHLVNALIDGNIPGFKHGRHVKPPKGTGSGKLIAGAAYDAATDVETLKKKHTAAQHLMNSLAAKEQGSKKHPGPARIIANESNWLADHAKWRHESKKAKGAKHSHADIWGMHSDARKKAQDQFNDLEQQRKAAARDYVDLGQQIVDANKTLAEQAASSPLDDLRKKFDAEDADVDLRKAQGSASADDVRAERKAHYDELIGDINKGMFAGEQLTSARQMATSLLNDAASSDAPSADQQAQLDRAKQQASDAMNNAAVSDAALSVFTGSGDLGRGGSSAYGAAQNVVNVNLGGVMHPGDPNVLNQIQKSTLNALAGGQVANQMTTNVVVSGA